MMVIPDDERSSNNFCQIISNKEAMPTQWYAYKSASVTGWGTGVEILKEIDLANLNLLHFFRVSFPLIVGVWTLGCLLEVTSTC